MAVSLSFFLDAPSWRVTTLAAGVRPTHQRLPNGSRIHSRLVMRYLCADEWSEPSWRISPGPQWAGLSRAQTGALASLTW